ncbi:galactosyltransferase-related protein [Arthrobacter sp. H35-D1]|uniref:glycosyltransferase family 2 protein n=1 Tax=Arthrobacter sp. H35-D1 TaxID=3046202 RepID=UPI0024B95589|nr:galactosyltransferase-related protein [Arthrobacter sp. H35-D1]MDJ0315433.1 galactosyltransferase-related protein [Arthrobacter sp. H35-D1]
MAIFSVLVLVHGRTEHLRRLLAGVDASDLRPAEVVIVYMNEPSPAPMQCVVPLRTVHISSSQSHSGLPLARARNAAAAAAQSANLVFLDVDSIPSANLFATFMQVLSEGKVLAMAEPRYLKKPLDSTLRMNDETLLEGSVQHHTRKGLPRESTMSAHAMFWSLGFAIHASAFADVGGFDEGYSGYGGEDTDFAFRIREAGIPVQFVDAPVFHQHHGVYSPPLNHFLAIIDNARLFHVRWSVWPMEGWLNAFVHRGLIAWTPSQSSLIVQRMPTPQEVESARSSAAY